MQSDISILGCGWLGLPLGAELVKKGFIVNGSTTRNENFVHLKDFGIIPFLVCINDQAVDATNLPGFLNTEILVVNFPPQRRPDIETYHPAQIRILIEILRKSPVEKVLFVSSTSVYPDVNREVTEEESGVPSKGSGRALLEAEHLFRKEDKFKTTILRLAGLIGGDRLPGRFLAGKKDLKNGQAPVNLIHRDDCIGLIYEIILQEAWGEVFNGCTEDHPKRSEYYRRAAEMAGLEPPVFTESAVEEVRYKLISSAKIKNRLGYEFKYPSPMNALMQ